MCAGNKLISCCTRWKPQIAKKSDYIWLHRVQFMFTECILHRKKKKPFTFRGEKHIVWERSQSE